MRQKAILRKLGGRTIFTFALFVALMSGVKQAEASILFSYSDSSGNSAYGLLSATALGGGQYLATSGTVTVTGAVAGTYSLVPGGPAPFFASAFLVDNVISPSVDPILDVYGILFVNGSTYLNIWGNFAGNYSFYAYDGASFVVARDGAATASATVSASVVPEPATLTIWGVGALICSLAAARRRKQLT